MKKPAFQFYVGDWQRNPNLRRCSFAEKGIWIDIMCIMHDQNEYGILRWTLKEISKAVGCKMNELKNLVSKGVLKGADVGERCEEFTFRPRHGRKWGDPVILIPAQCGPIWYSSRMVKDEYIRCSRGASTWFEPEGQDSAPETERKRLRRQVFLKTNGYCFHCKVKLADDWEIDHFIPRSKGGNNKFENLVPSCKTCNQDKLDTMPSDWIAPTRGHGEGLGVGPSTSTSTSTSSSTSPSGITTVVAPSGEDLLFQMFRRSAGRHIGDDELRVEVGKFVNKYPNIHPNQAGALVNTWVANIGRQPEPKKRIVV